jgi:phosphoglycerate dehydrogenase-like enzyme
MPTNDPLRKIKLLVIASPEHYALRPLNLLADLADITVSDDQATLEEVAVQAEVILDFGIMGTFVDFPRVWQFARGVRWVHLLSAGVEKALFPELIESDVPVTNARGVFKRSLAEYAVLGILFHTKKVRRLLDNQRAHKWDDFRVNFADKLVMGVVGYGEIGRECALLARGLGLKILAVRRHPERSAQDPLLDGAFGPDQLVDMLKVVDVLLCAAPLTAETRHMISDAQLNAMKPTAIVVNVGRGPVIDEDALIRALRDGRIAGASLDVFEEEPLPESSPLWDMPNVLISPHCTDRTVDPDFLELSMQAFVANFRRYVAHEPLENVVDKRAGY